MKNTLGDLNNYLFEQLERLQDDDLDDATLAREIERSNAVKGIATTIIANADLAYKVMKHADDYGDDYELGFSVLGIERK